MAEFHGHLRLAAELREGGRTVLAGQVFRAPYHVSKPYWDELSRTLLVQVVNPTAGILAGDRLTAELSVGEGAALLLTTPSASRIFAMREGEAVSVQTFQVRSGGWLEVWPEPVVPHRGSRFRQDTELLVAKGGALLYADLLNVGRAAHGEAWAWERLQLGLSVRVDGELVLRERFDHPAAELKGLGEWAGATNSVGFGNAVFVEPVATSASGAPPWRERLHALQGEGTWIGVSALRLPGAWSIKFVAPDGVALRAVWQQIRAALATVAPHLTCDARKL